MRLVLSHERRWAFPRISGVITTPTLRADGSLLSASGYDPRTELYLRSSIVLPVIPAHPTREQALAALAVLKGLFAEFSFKRRASDLSVTLSGLLTALLRGSLPTAPVFLVRADTPAVGKSYLVDIISMVATGGLCPVITALHNGEETEKRLGALLLNGSRDRLARQSDPRSRGRTAVPGRRAADGAHPYPGQERNADVRGATPRYSPPATMSVSPATWCAAVW